MTEYEKIQDFLSKYDKTVQDNAVRLRKLIFDNLPDIKEKLDLPAKMIAYVYGEKYADMICTLIPSQKGLKLGFYKGTDLPDPQNLLRGNGKISRYVEIKNPDDLNPNALKTLLKAALSAYKARIKN